MKRIFLIVLDSVGAGALPDAAAYGDAGANTLGHIIEKAHPRPSQHGGHGPGPDPGRGRPQACERRRRATAVPREVSAGKDTTTGHWEIAGLRLDTPFPTYPNGFPPEVMNAFEAAIGTETLGNYPASRHRRFMEELGAEHMRTGYPIVYTSADSVFQIACARGRRSPGAAVTRCAASPVRILTGPNALGRVIARPFVGTGRGHFCPHGPPARLLSGAHWPHGAQCPQGSRPIHHGHRQDRGYLLHERPVRKRPRRRQPRLRGFAA